MTYECLKVADKRRHGLLFDWERWLVEADRLYARFLNRVGESPFLYHEVSSVGFLAAAAAMAGFTPLAEYEVIKRGREDKRARVDGRADFWFSSDARAYSFEFKRAYFAATGKNLAAALACAVEDVACIPRGECHYATAGLIARVRDEHRLPTYRTFAQGDDVDLAYRIGPDGEDGAFLFFKLVD